MIRKLVRRFRRRPRPMDVTRFREGDLVTCLKLDGKSYWTLGAIRHPIVGSQRWSVALLRGGFSQVRDNCVRTPTVEDLVTWLDR